MIFRRYWQWQQGPIFQQYGLLASRFLRTFIVQGSYFIKDAIFQPQQLLKTHAK